jgi:alkanesulfonate monooxygenase SsuD/methylene tetrahydromethanopterin reductase-like flavin-dependent oxidoreductase (luciferase family)
MTPSINPMLRENRFKLGLFSANCSGGMSLTKAPERWDASWDNNLRLARMADEAGLDFLLPVARWIGFPGSELTFMKSVLETTTWAAGLLASTRDIAVVSTIHTAANNPVVVAKQVATLDQIGHGRAGINIVAGWFKPEYEALGLKLPTEHKVRYAYAQEWFDIVAKLWTSEDRFDWDGANFQLKDVYGDPKPLRGKVPIINAGGSPEGRAFAMRNANFLFTPAIDLTRSIAEVAELKQQAAKAGREVGVLTFSHVVCRPTEQEAKDYYASYVAQSDWDSVDYALRMQFATAFSFPHDLLAQIRERFAAGHGGFPLTGDPEQVADGIEQLYRAGFAGTTLSFVNYVDEFPFFARTVLPILEARGIRTVRPEAEAKAA